MMATVDLASFVKRGILCRARGAQHSQVSIADSDMLARRRGKRVPSGLTLREYVNLYFNARNAMLFKVLSNPHPELCILCVDPSVLDIPGCVISDCGAATGWVRFKPSPAGLAEIDANVVYHNSWSTSGIVNHKARMMAEVLIPHQVPWSYVMEVKTPCAATAAKIGMVIAPTPATVAPHLFFR